MPQDVLELFKANEIAFLKPLKKGKCRKLDPVCVNGSQSVLSKFGQSEIVEERDDEVEVKRQVHTKQE